MKAFPVFVSLLCIGGLLSAADPLAVKVGPEWTVTGDFDGDGNADMALLSPDAGTYRVVYADAGGAVSSPTRQLGVSGLEGVGVGRVGQPLRDRLVLASPALNRLQILDDASRTSATVAEGMALTGIGPRQAVVLPEIVPSLGIEADVAVISQWNATGFRLERRDGDTGALLQGVEPAADYRHGNRFRFKTTEPWNAAFLYTDGNGDEFVRVVDLDDPVPGVLLNLPLAGTGNQFVSAVIPPQSTTRVLSWTSGGDTLIVHDIQLSAGTGFESAGSVSFDFPGQELAAVQVIQTDPARLLLLFQNGDPAELVEFNGVDTLNSLATYPAPAGGTFSGGAAFDDGTFALFSRMDGADVSDQVKIVDSASAPYKVLQTLSLPEQPASVGSNVFVYSGEPFVASDSVRLYNTLAPDWSTEGEINVNELQATRLLDQGGVSGLDSPGEVIGLGNWTAGGSVLYNQWETDIAIASLRTEIGPRSIEARVTPGSGYYERAVEVEFSALPAGTVVVYRAGTTGSWIPYGEPFYLARDTTMQFFGLAPDGSKGPIQSVSYTFPDPDSMDSDDDGIPDYVEIEKGLNPLGGFDQDEDGWSDLDELLKGTSAVDGSVTPPDGTPRAPSWSGIDLWVTPVAHNTSAVVEVVAPLQLPVRLATLDGGQISMVQTTNHVDAAGVNPSAYFPNVPAGPDFDVLTLATPASFPVRGDLSKATQSTLNSGRELLAVLPPPEDGELAVPYNHGGGNAATEADAWLAAAGIYYTNIGARQRIETLDRYDTLVALIYEYALGVQLLAREEVATSDITLFPLRGEDVEMPAVTLSQIRRLRRVGPQGEVARDPFVYLENLQSSVDAGAGKVADLKALTDEVYRISTLFGNETPGQYPSPVGVIRAFLRNGTIPAPYLTQTSLTAPELTAAQQAAAALLAGFSARPIEESLVLTVPESGIPAGCTVLEDLLGNPVALLDVDGDPFPLPLAFELEPGMEFVVSGYSDVESPCAGTALEVITLVLVDVVIATGNDADGNLMPDDMERFLLGTTGGAHDGDRDGDGYSDLQEILDGTDPRDGSSHSGTGPVSLALPEVTIEAGAASEIHWTWPAAYQGAFRFKLQQVSSLTGEFQDAGGLPVTQGNQMEFAVPEPGPGETVFYRIGISLR